PRVAGVDHQGQVVAEGHGDLRREHLSLHVPGRVLVEVVEPALAHGHHTGPDQELLQALDAVLASWGWTPAVANTSSWSAAAAMAARESSRSHPTVTMRWTPPARASATTSATCSA